MGRKIPVQLYLLRRNGIPHAVVPLDAARLDGDRDSLRAFARALRHDAAFPKGANVNLCAVTAPDTVRLVTFERGVEDFTLACGTGVGLPPRFGSIFSCAVAVGAAGASHAMGVAVGAAVGVACAEVASVGVACETSCQRRPESFILNSIAENIRLPSQSGSTGVMDVISSMRMSP